MNITIIELQKMIKEKQLAINKKQERLRELVKMSRVLQRRKEQDDHHNDGVVLSNIEQEINNL